MFAGLVICVSIALQFMTVLFALRLIRTTGIRLSWVFISTAIFLMGVRRLFALPALIAGTPGVEPGILYEVLGLLTSGLMLAGVVLIHPVFRSLRRNEEKLKALSITDELTGLYNRRGLATFAEHHIRLANRSKKGFLLLYADLDDMKHINDTGGHQEGDLALTATAKILRKTFRNSDIFARIGGDEFVVMPVGCAGDGIDVLTARLQKNIDSYNAAGKGSHKLALSSGVALYDPAAPCSLDELLNRGDEAMYSMKKHHRFLCGSRVPAA